MRVRGGRGLWERSGRGYGRGSGPWVGFFVSYTQADQAGAEWIAWELEEAGHRVRAWDFVPGGNWIQGMQQGVTRAGRTIAVPSPAYVASEYVAAGWPLAERALAITEAAYGPGHPTVAVLGSNRAVLAQETDSGASTAGRASRGGGQDDHCGKEAADGGA